MRGDLKHLIKLCWCDLSTASGALRPSRARVDVHIAGDLAHDVAKGAHTKDGMLVLGPSELSADV